MVVAGYELLLFPFSASHLPREKREGNEIYF